MNDNEILLCKIKLPDNTRPIFVFAVYFPPRLKPGDVRASLEEISEKITQPKVTFSNPCFLIAGDVNQFPIHEAIADHADLEIADTPPTRGTACLDVVASNFNHEILECFVEAPLENEDMVSSDHGVLVLRILLTHKHDFTWIKYKTREIDETGKRNFATEFVNFDWTALTARHDNPSDLTRVVQKKIEEMNDQHFLWKLRKIHSTDDPWITDKVRRAICRCKREYKKTKARRRGAKDGNYSNVTRTISLLKKR